jgi:hypothetical protein
MERPQPSTAPATAAHLRLETMGVGGALLHDLIRALFVLPPEDRLVCRTEHDFVGIGTASGIGSAASRLSLRELGGQHVEPPQHERSGGEIGSYSFDASPALNEVWPAHSIFGATDDARDLLALINVPNRRRTLPDPLTCVPASAESPSAEGTDSNKPSDMSFTCP